MQQVLNGAFRSEIKMWISSAHSIDAGQCIEARDLQLLRLHLAIAGERVLWIVGSYFTQSRSSDVCEPPPRLQRKCLLGSMADRQGNCRTTAKRH